SFAYTILRHQVFGLDVLMRRVLLRTSGIVMSTLLFAGVWFALNRIGFAPSIAALMSAALCGFAMPSVTRWVAVRLDAWLYKPLARLNHGPTLTHEQGLDALGAATATRLRQLLPIQWAALVIHDDTT